MNKQDRQNLFADLTIRHQGELYAYIFSIVRNWEDADDLYQSVCLILWNKFESFRPDSSFLAWARQTAKFTIRDYLKRKRLRRYVSEDLLESLAEAPMENENDAANSYMTALRHCKAKLNATDEELLEFRYVEDLGSGQIADRLQRSQPSVCRSLARVQRWLLACVRMEVARQEHERGRP